MIFPLLNSHKGKPNNELSACKIDIPFPFQTLGYRDLKIIKIKASMHLVRPGQLLNCSLMDRFVQIDSNQMRLQASSKMAGLAAHYIHEHVVV